MTTSNAEIKLTTPLPEEIFSDIAKNKAEAVAKEKSGEKNNSTQLRKFYDELCMWSDKVHSSIKLEKDQKSDDIRNARYNQSAPFIKMMNAKVAYAKGRNHVDETFEQMFSHLIKEIKDPDTLKHAKLFMEAFMGFYKAQEK